jgi:hypothetical protein
LASKRWRTRPIVGLIPIKSIARQPDEKNESNDQKEDNQHPILAFDAEKSEWLDEKLHQSRPVLVHGKQFLQKNILFFYG